MNAAPDQFAPAAPADRPDASPAHVRSLDGLRGLAIAGVLAVHAGVPFFAAGWLGVDLFFVLSGFLITSLICREVQTTGGFYFIGFWVRRALRILPPYYLYISVITLLILCGFGDLTEHHGFTPGLYLASLWLYFVNYIPQGGIWSHQMLTLHLWSLAVEEQFYLLWPLLFLVFRSIRQMLIVSTVLTVMVLIIRITSAPVQTLLYTRGLPIFLGCTAALYLAQFKPSVSARFTNVSLVLALIATLVVAIPLGVGRLTEDQAHRQLVPFVVICYALMIAALWACRSAHFAGFLGWGPLVYLGKISYGVYLYHMLFHQLTWHVLLADIDRWPPLIKFPIRVITYVGLTILMAALSHRYFERPFLRLKDRFRAPAGSSKLVV
jgi:peptidoglycan/LPS O-acetylase OafA/YrhL